MTWEPAGSDFGRCDTTIVTLARTSAMRHSIATDKERLDAPREQWDGGGAEVISNAADVADAGVRRRREPLKAGADRLLSLAAAPTFAFMAVFTASHSGGMPDM